MLNTQKYSSIILKQTILLSKNHLMKYPTPVCLTYFWSVGFAAAFILASK